MDADRFHKHNFMGQSTGSQSDSGFSTIHGVFRDASSTLKGHFPSKFAESHVKNFHASVPFLAMGVTTALFGGKMKYVHYRSIGNSVGLKEDIEDYFEIDAEGYVERSIHVLRNGELLKYDRTHLVDQYGILPEGTVTSDDLDDPSFGQTSLITSEDFEIQWKRLAKNRK